MIFFSRKWAVEIYKRFLPTLWMPFEETELVAYLDSDNEGLENELRTILKGFSQYNGVRLVYTNRPALGDKERIFRRRKRVVEIKEDSKKYIADSDIIFCLEDDTTCPTETFRIFLDHLLEDKKVGLVSGVQVGRWNAKLIGAWEITKDRIQSAEYKENGTQKFQGTGFFCYATRTKLYKEFNYRIGDFPTGPDVWYGYNLYKKGYKVIVDWGIKCPHHLENGEIIEMTKNDTIQLKWKKIKRGDREIWKRIKNNS